MKAFKARRRQSGVSLISMMIGLMISLLVIASMLVFYKSIIEVTGNASRAAQRDGQVSAALVAAQMDLQSAGFGVPASTAGAPLSDNLVFLASDLTTRITPAPSANTGPYTAKEILWRAAPATWQPGTVPTYQCSGLLIVEPPGGYTVGKQTNAGLYRLPPKPCAAPPGPPSWPAWAFPADMSLIAGSAAFFAPTQKNGTVYSGGDVERGGASLSASANASGTTGYVFTAASGSCLPYMQQNAATAPLPSSPEVALVQASDPSNVLFVACLSNLAGSH
jgi:hypothetical protein